MILPRPLSPINASAFRRTLSLAALLAITACKPPAADEYAGRIAIGETREAPAKPADSPGTEGAIWADSAQPERMLYGIGGSPALLALGCAEKDGVWNIRITRFIAADPEAKALMALIGNGHTSRMPVDAIWNGKVWLWEGVYDPANPDLDALTGPRKVEITIPGAGSVMLNPSSRPADLIERCRILANTRSNSAP